jgi:serine/threonine protein kinase
MIGKRIGNYRVVRQIGRGGMGAVFEAVHEDIGKRVAIKVLHGRFSQDQQVITRFFNEARALTSIGHPGIVQIFDFGELDGRTRYIAMEYMEGESLSQRLARTPRLPAGVAMRLCRQVASALSAAHAQRVVHRDLKPGNIMIVADPEAAGGERAKVFDFGIAKLLGDGRERGEERTEHETRADVLMGTPTYMSPEQCRGAGLVDERTDVYALGVVLYQMLSGRPPFLGEGDGDVLAKHIHEAPRPLQEIDPTLPPGLCWLVTRMLAKLPSERPSMAQVVQDLEGLGSKATGAISAVAAPLHHPDVAAPTVMYASSTSQHQVGERVERRSTWKRPPAALWVVAVLAVLAPLGVLIKRRLATPAPVLALPGEQMGAGQRESRPAMQGPLPGERTALLVEPLPGAQRPRPGEGPAPAEPGPGRIQSQAQDPDRGQADRPARPDKDKAERPDKDKAERMGKDRAEPPAPPPQEDRERAAQRPRPAPPARAEAPDLRPAAVERPGPAQAHHGPPDLGHAPPVPAPERPKNVLAAVVRKDRVGGTMPSLPAVVKSQYRGTGPLTLSYKICVDRDGRVSGVTAFSGGSSADEGIMSALRTWVYRPQPVPICFVEAFSFVID